MSVVTGHLHDPNRVNLRKAARAAIVVPAVFALFVVTGDTPSALFASFGCFAALVFADFGGPLRRRFRAYLVLAVVSAVLVALGTACADTVWPAVAATLVVVFAISMAGALGGYFAAGGTAATLGFVLAVMEPGVDADLASRELGWVLGVVVAGAAAVTLWPVHQRDRVRAAAAVVLGEASTALAVPAAHRDLSALAAADAELTQRAGVVYRPAGSIARERALVALVVAVGRLLPLLHGVSDAESSPAADTTPEYEALARAVAQSLAASARVVAREADTAGGVAALTDARAAHTAALERWAASALAVDGGGPVIDRFTATFPLRRLSLAALEVAEDLDDVVDDRVRSRDEGASAVADASRILRAHAHPRSVRFRNAARAALGLALAVLVARTASLQHSFWVVLGALTVLRSNALGTGATALQALTGALVGFGIAALVMTTVGADDTWLWIVLPIVVFLAAYTPGAVNFVVGQAGFTVFVVVLFNILVPDGWRTGLVRVQDVAIGAGISVAVGVLLWPRGARTVARRSFAELLRAVGSHLELALGVALRDDPNDLAAAVAAVASSRARAVAALEDLVLEHGGGQVDRSLWGGLLVDAFLLERVALGLVRGGGEHPMPARCPAALDALEQEGRSVTDAVDREADRLVDVGARAVGAAPTTSTPVPAALTRCLDTRSTDELDGALRLVWVQEWLTVAAGHVH